MQLLGTCTIREADDILGILAILGQSKIYGSFAQVSRSVYGITNCGRAGLNLVGDASQASVRLAVPYWLAASWSKK
jgi:hypothetical protein